MGGGGGAGGDVVVRPVDITRALLSSTHTWRSHPSELGEGV